MIKFSNLATPLLKEVAKPFYILFMSILVRGCENKPEETEKNAVVFSFKDIKENISLSGAKYEFEEILQPGRLLYKDNRLMVLDASLKGHIGHLIDAKNMLYMGPQAERGNGPGEMPSGWSLDPGKDDGHFWIHSLEAKMFSRYNLTGTKKAADLQIKQHADFFLALGLAWSSDTTLMTFLASGPERFVEFHIDGIRLSSFGKWEDLMIPGDFPDHVIADLHQGKLSGNPKKNRFIKASLFRDHLEILDKASGRIITVDGPINEVPEFKAARFGALIPNPRLAYMDSYIGDNFIFGLYSGRTDKEIMTEGRGEDQLIMFDFEGRPLVLYKLDTKIKNFTVDEANQTLYGITVDENPGIVVFKMKNR